MQERGASFQSRVPSVGLQGRSGSLPLHLTSVSNLQVSPLHPLHPRQGYIKSPFQAVTAKTTLLQQQCAPRYVELFRKLISCPLGASYTGSNLLTSFQLLAMPGRQLEVRLRPPATLKSNPHARAFYQFFVISGRVLLQPGQETWLRPMPPSWQQH